MNAATVKNKPEDSSIPSIRILKIGTCPSLSGKSTLTYHIGCTDDGQVMIRLFSNTGGGFFSNEWISMNRIQQVSNTIPADKPVTSFSLLSPAYLGRSQNSFGFLLAALKQEGLVVPADGDERVYLRIAPEKFMEEVSTLIKGGVDLAVADKPKKSAPVIADVSIKKLASKFSQKKSI